MQKNPESPKQEDCPEGTRRTNMTCSECGEIFKRPLFTTASSRGKTEMYYACPRCMTKVRDVEKLQNAPTPRVTNQVHERQGPHVKIEVETKCAHFFGYLRKKEKDAPIPEECLTCDQMVECLLQ